MEEKNLDLLSPARGMRDFLPEEKKLRDFVAATFKRQFELYAFRPLETPAVERFEVLASKYAGGDEILKEVFKLSDQGGRELGLRYDLTVPLCRVVANNPRMQMPFKRYQIAPVWRDGPLKQGRFREFWQCDVDAVGSRSMLSDAEILAVTADSLAELFGKENFSVKVSSRKLMAGILEEAGIAGDKEMAAILSIDKLAKVGKAGVLEELERKGVGKEAGEKALELASAKKLAELEGKIGAKAGKEGIEELNEVFSFAEKMGCGDALEFDACLARGLQYYTGTVFEAYLKNSPITSSVAGGGRYDDLIGKFAGKSERVPAVGISFGLDVICEALKLKGGKGGGAEAGKSVFVIPVTREGNAETVLSECIKVAGIIRLAGIGCGLDLMRRSPGKNLEYASKNGFSSAVIVGESELKQGRVKLRNLATGEEKLVEALQVAGALGAA